MDAHLVGVPGLGTLTARSLAGLSGGSAQFLVTLFVIDLGGARRRTVILRVLVGMRTGPLTRRSLFLARSMSSWQTFSRDWTLREVRVMPKLVS